MTGFEMLFAFYSLMLGLALANATTGFANVWRNREGAQIGTLVPLLCLVVVSYVPSQWLGFWVNRDVFTLTPFLLLTAMAVILPYVFLSQAMFPERPERWRTLDDYVLANAPVILGPLLIAPVIAVAVNLIYGSREWVEPVLRVLLTLALPVAMIWRPRLWLHRIGLAGMIAFNLFRLFNRG